MHRLRCSGIFRHVAGNTHIFMPPAWKVRQGHLVFGSSVCLSVRLSVRNSVPLTFKVQYLKFGLSYSNQTWTGSSSEGCSPLINTTCPWGGAGSKFGTKGFCHILTLLPPGASVFHKHMSSFCLPFLSHLFTLCYPFAQVLHTCST